MSAIKKGKLLSSIEACMSAAQSLLAVAEESDLVVRLTGSVACQAHCVRYRDRFSDMGRESPLDLDLVIPSKDRRRWRELFDGLAYEEDRDVLMAMEGRRYAYRNPENGLHVDVFVDRLDFCFSIELKDRLFLDSPTIPLADLVLAKLQIVEINQKDLIDVVVLTLEHELGSEDREKIDASYVAKILANDWGFYYTAKENLRKVSRLLERPWGLSAEERSLVGTRVDALAARIEAEPKGMRWRARAKIGTRVKWYKDVSDKEATF